MDQLRAIRYFIEVAEQNSFARAAERFGVPASSISRRISDLEASLSTQLLIRNTRHVALTELGRQYYEQSSKIVRELDHQHRLLSAAHHTPSGKLTISSMVGFGERFLIPILEEFQELYPDVELHVHLSDSLTKLQSDDVDIAIRGGYAPDERIVAVELMDNQFVACAAQSYLDRYGIPQTTLALREHQGLFYATPNGATPWLTQIDSQWHKVSGKNICTTNHGPWLIKQAIAGKGILMLPRWVLAPHFESNELVELSFVEPLTVTQQPNFAVFLLYQKLDYSLPKVKVCVDFIRQKMANLPILHT